MPFVKIDEKTLWTGLNGLLDIDDFKDKIGSLKGKSFGIDYIVTIKDIFEAAITKVEELCNEAGESGVGKEKRDAVVKFLDDIIALPFYLEWLDGPAIGAIVDILVGFLFPKK
jgi:hypothetical protein